MAWEWSHTAEAYADAQANLEDLPAETLRVIWAEWRALCVGHDDDAGDDADFCEDCYRAALSEAQALTADALTEDIWQRASEQATCDNGGFEAWLCPFGCGCHTVPFDRS